MNNLDANESKPGASLKAAREKLGLSINDVSIATKISLRVLKALEAGKVDELPAASFTRGFIRSYAAYLKIDSAPILNEFSMVDKGASPKPAHPAETETILTEEPLKLSETADTTQTKSAAEPESPAISTTATWAGLNDPSITNKAVLASALLVVALLVFAIKKIVDKYAQERVIAPIAAPVDGKSEGKDAPTEKLAENSGQEGTSSESDVESAKDLSNENVAITVPDVTDKNEAPKAGAAESSAAPVESTTSKETTNSAAPTVAKPETTAPAPTATEAKKAAPVKKIAPQEIIIEALDSVTVTVTIDDEDPKKMTLNPESLSTIKAKSKIEIEAADGGMINIIHNGRDRGVPGDLGKPIKLKYP